MNGLYENRALKYKMTTRFSLKVFEDDEILFFIKHNKKKNQFIDQMIEIPYLIRHYFSSSSVLKTRQRAL